MAVARKADTPFDFLLAVVTVSTGVGNEVTIDLAIVYVGNL
jgi:hypothetical protein